MTKTPWTDTLPPALEDIEALAQAACDALPPEFAAVARGVHLRVEDFAPDDLLAEIGLEDPFELSGLYIGVPMPEKSVMDQVTAPDTIWLFRRPILDEWAGRGGVSLGDLVAHVFVHELAHHFGWSDEEIATIAPWTDWGDSTPED